MRQKDEMIKAAMVTDTTVKHAQKLVSLFGKESYASLHQDGNRIGVKIEECLTLRLMGTALCGLVAQNPDVDLPEFRRILVAMRKAKKSLKEEIRIHRDYLKARL